MLRGSTVSVHLMLLEQCTAPNEESNLGPPSVPSAPAQCVHHLFSAAFPLAFTGLCSPAGACQMEFNSASLSPKCLGYVWLPCLVVPLWGTWDLSITFQKLWDLCGQSATKRRRFCPLKPKLQCFDPPGLRKLFSIMHVWRRDGVSFVKAAWSRTWVWGLMTKADGITALGKSCQVGRENCDAFSSVWYI